mgnify:CR=1 FL=1
MSSNAIHSASQRALSAVAGQLANCGAVALEALDSFSARGALEGRSESPWDRLRVTVAAAKSVPVGIVAAARTLFGDRPVAADLAHRFVTGACESGAKRVRVIDPLNDAEAMLPFAEAAAAGGAVLVPTLILGPVPGPTDERWLDEARAIAKLPGATSICLVDRAGHLRPAELAQLVPRIAEVTGLPVELSLVGPGGLASVAAVEGIEAGAARVQAAVGAAALAAARPTVETLRAALAGGPRELQCERALINRLAGVIWSLIPADRLRQAQATEGGPALGLPLDLEGDFAKYCNTTMVDLEPVLAETEQGARLSRDYWHLGEADEVLLKGAIVKHAGKTGSERAKVILADWNTYRGKFVKIFPKEYRRALGELAAARKKAAA